MHEGVIGVKMPLLKVLSWHRLNVAPARRLPPLSNFCQLRLALQPPVWWGVMKSWSVASKDCEARVFGRMVEMHGLVPVIAVRSTPISVKPLVGTVVWVLLWLLMYPQGPAGSLGPGLFSAQRVPAAPLHIKPEVRVVLKPPTIGPKC